MSKYSLFEIFGIEAEYMIVDKKTLKTLPLTEFILKELNNGEVINEVTLESVAWSNELVSHVIELKTSPPAESLDNLDEVFHEATQKIQKMLDTKGAMLLPTAAHPWFNPDSETILWPYGQKEIYQKYDEIFSCKGHGWSNLQSVHINLPFKNEEEFGKLMMGIRFVIPFIPYLAASSLFMDGKLQTNADARLDVYEKNQAKIPSIAGDVVPEPIYDFKGYYDMLENMYKDISSFDPDKILQDTWLNSRGAIAKFDVGAIEIRVMDIGESPLVDISLVNFIVSWIKYLTFELTDRSSLKNFSQEKLVNVYHQSKGFMEFDLGQDFFTLLKINANDLSVKTYLQKVFELVGKDIPKRQKEVIGHILSNGNLSKRIKAFESVPTEKLYMKLAKCLRDNSIF